MMDNEAAHEGWPPEFGYRALYTHTHQFNRWLAQTISALMSSQRRRPTIYNKSPCLSLSLPPPWSGATLATINSWCAVSCTAAVLCRSMSTPRWRRSRPSAPSICGLAAHGLSARDHHQPRRVSGGDLANVTRAVCVIHRKSVVRLASGRQGTGPSSHRRPCSGWYDGFLAV